MRFDLITLFPKLFDSFLSESLIKKAQDKKILKFSIHDLRDFTTDKHRTVDDMPYGGGAGMLLKIEPLVKVLKFIKEKSARGGPSFARKSRIILLSPSGKQFDQKKAESLAKKYDQLIFLCGRYEGFDARIKKFVDEEISIGPYVLNGGEVAAMAVCEAVGRLVPGVVGNKESLKEESHTLSDSIEYSQYTRPENFRGLKVPKVLLSGNHKKITDWRAKHTKKRNKKTGI